MKKFNMLVLTDHTHHSIENSLYALVRAAAKHPRCAQIDIASRGNPLNDFFFTKHITKGLFVTRVDESFVYDPNGRSYSKKLRRQFLRHYDVIWLRLPPPVPVGFLHFLEDTFPHQLFINNPAGIRKTGNKAYLLNFPDLCPPMRLCRSLEDILDFSLQFPIVLKPLREYGGRGIVKVDRDRIWLGNQEASIDHLKRELGNREVEYLAVKYLELVSQGDKRIAVADGRIMGASLRLAGPDSWLCNAAMGGSSHPTEVDQDERRIIEQIHPHLQAEGILIYGVDTLTGGDGRRVLSEINTTSIGGFVQIQALSGRPVVKETVGIIWDFVTGKLLGKEKKSP